MEIQLSINRSEYKMLMLMIRHEQNDNSYMIHRANTEKQIKSTLSSLQDYGKDLKQFKEKIEAAFDDALRRTAPVDKMA